MRYAKVKVISISGRNNKIHKLGDVVNEGMFVKGRFDELLKGGYIRLIGDNKKPVSYPDRSGVEVKVAPVDETPQGILEAKARKLEIGPKPEDTARPAAPSKEDLDDTTRKEIMAALNKAGVKFSKNATKEELYEKWRAINK